jgi:hypothetical protein
MPAEARNPVLNAKTQGSITKICFDAIAGGVIAYARCAGESVQSQSSQISLQKNSRTEGDAISSGEYSDFYGRQFRFRRFRCDTIHAGGGQQCKKGQSHVRLVF